MNEVIDGPTPASLEELIAMCKRQVAEGVPGAEVDLQINEEIRDGKLTVAQAAIERPKRLAAA